MSVYDEGKLAGQRAIELFADLGAETELKHVLAMGPAYHSSGGK